MIDREHTSQKSIAVSYDVDYSVAADKIYSYPTVFQSRAVLIPAVVIGRFTYEIAPVFVLMEQLTLKKMREMIGWPDGEGDGLFSPGQSNYVTFIMASLSVMCFFQSSYFCSHCCTHRH